MNYFSTSQPGCDPIELDGHLIYPADTTDFDNETDGFSPALRELRERLSREVILRESEEVGEADGDELNHAEADELSIEDAVPSRDYSAEQLPFTPANSFDAEEERPSSRAANRETDEPANEAPTERTADPIATITADDVDEHCNEIENYLRQLLGDQFNRANSYQAGRNQANNDPRDEQTVPLNVPEEPDSLVDLRPKRLRESSILTSEELARYNAQLNAFREVSHTTTKQAIRQADSSRRRGTHFYLGAAGTCSVACLASSFCAQQTGDGYYLLSVGVAVVTAGFHLALLATPK